jgi:hypothetical protein
VTTAEKYVTAAYLVVLAVVLAYVVLYAFKLARLGRQVEELGEMTRARGSAPPPRSPSRDPSARLTRQ